MVDPGTMRLHDAVRPALVADTYKFTVQTDPGHGAAVMGGERYVAVEAPRFRIEAREIVSAFPMPGSRGGYDDQLPWVALRRRTLPWERRGASADRASPWLALVVTLPGEAELVEAPLAAVVGPAAAARFGADPGPVTALRFPSAAAMASVLPSESDARLLCHVREVNQADTELAGNDDDGWVSVVVANRMITTDTETLWRATLISREHRDDLATGSPQTAAVLALASWEFTGTGGASFQTLVTGLDRAAFGAEHRKGVALDRTGHDGKTIRVRYRSPLSPAADPDEAPDITRIAARELGRLLAAADGRLVGELVTWRRSRLTDAARQVTTDLLSSAHRAQSVSAPAGHRASAALAALGQIAFTTAADPLPAARPTGFPAAAPGREDL